MRVRLLAVLMVLAAFATGFYFDRWLHRPMVISFSAHETSIEKTLLALPAYDSVEEAAVHGAARLYECSHVYECGAAIALRPDGRFSLGPVRSDEHGDEVEVQHGVPTMFGWRLAADIHSHPCLPTTHVPGMFSPQDVSSSLSHRLTGFMVDLCTGNVHEFDPTRDSSNDIEVNPGLGIYATAGRVVGKIPVDGKSVEPNVVFEGEVND